MNKINFKRMALALVLALSLGFGVSVNPGHAAANSSHSAASGTIVLRSIGAYDGQVREYADDYWFGNAVNSTSSQIFVGDDMARRLVYGILDFDTSALPDTATITGARLEVYVTNLHLRNGNPYYTLFSDMCVDVVSPYFGDRPGMESMDFEASATDYSINCFDEATRNHQWIGMDVDPSYIDPTAHMQFRLYFMDDNNDSMSQGVSFASGNYPIASLRPTLTVYYDVP